MDDEQVRTEGSRKRERLVALLLVLFPLFVMAGFFAPGVVQLLVGTETAEPVAREVVEDRVGPYAHRPLLVPLDFSPELAPPLLDLDDLFLVPARRPELPEASTELVEKFAGISAFDRSYGDSITRDNPLHSVTDFVFRDALMEYRTPVDVLIASMDPLGTNLRLCSNLPAANCVRDDDLLGTTLVITAPIPEPGTAALLGFGLFGLAFAGRRR